MRVGGKLTTRRAVGVECVASVGAAGIAIFGFDATPLAVLLVLACVLTMAPALAVGGRDARRGRRA